MPMAVDNVVSAFAVYKGLAGNLSKRQRRRRNRKKNIQASEALNDANKIESGIDNENVKKRKNSEGKENDLLKLKKPKFNDFAVEKMQKHVKNGQLKPNSSKLLKKKLENTFKKPSLPSNPTKGKQSNEQIVIGKKKQVEKKMGNVIAKGNKSSKKNVKNVKDSIELLTEEQVLKKIVSKDVSHNNNQIESKSVAKKKKKKLKNTSTDNKHLEKPAVKQKRSSLDICLPEMVNQDNSPSMISEIKRIKQVIASEGPTKLNDPTYKQIVARQDLLSARLKSSIDEGEKLFQDLISPYEVNDFFRDYWEKAPLYIPAQNPEKFSSLISTELIDDYLRKNVVMFGKHIDITSYIDGKRETHNPEGRALPHVVWDLYKNKCSVRLLCPQAAFSNIFALNSKLQEYFGCFVGANVYLTPPKSQGFAPHYDDIEAFVLQIEGQKKWKVYKPRNSYETLPRYSSINFSQTELEDPLMEVTLRPGDLLYFPRGFIHQAECSKEAHSLHITVSMYQKNSWIDLLEKAVPLALSKAAKEDVEFRRGLPLNYLKRAGMAYKSHTMRKAFIKSVQDKITKLIKHLDIDKAVDMMGVQYITDALPPVFNLDEASRCVLGNGLRMERNGKLKGGVEFTADTRIRFTTALCHRLIKETVTREDGLVEEEIRLYYSNDNSLEYHGEEPQFLVIPEQYISAIRLLSNRYPNFIPIKSLPLPTLEEQASLVGDLWDRGLLMTEEPLVEQDVESSSSSEDEEESEELEVSKETKRKTKKMDKLKGESKTNVDNSSSNDEDEEEEEEEASDRENEELQRAYDQAIHDNDKYIDGEDFDYLVYGDEEEEEDDTDENEEEELDDFEELIEGIEEDSCDESEENPDDEDDDESIDTDEITEEELDHLEELIDGIVEDRSEESEENLDDDE